MPQSAPELGAALGDDRWQTRLNASLELRELGVRSTTLTIPQISRNLEDVNWRVRDSAAQCLGVLSRSDGWKKQWKRTGIRAKEAVPALMLRMSDSNLAVRRSAAAALEMLEATGSFGDLREAAGPCVPELLERLGADDWPQRVSAVNVLGTVGPPAVVAADRLIRCLVDNSYAVRSAARETIDRMVTEGVIVDRHALGASAVPTLAEHLDAKYEWQVRVSACFALGRFGGANVLQLPQLAKELEHEDWGVRATAARLLGKLGASCAAALVPLAERLDDNDPSVKGAVKVSIQQFQEGAEAAQEPVARLDLQKKLKKLRHWDMNIRESGVKGFLAIGMISTPAIPELADILRDSRKDVVLGALQVFEMLQEGGALGKLDMEAIAVDYMPALLGCLKEDNWLLRLTAAEALGNLAVLASKIILDLQELAEREPNEKDMAFCLAGRQILRRLVKKGAMANPKDIAQAAYKELRLASHFEGSEHRALRVMAQELLLRLAEAGLIQAPAGIDRLSVAQLRSRIPRPSQAPARREWRDPPPLVPRSAIQPDRGSGIHLPKAILDEADFAPGEKQKLVMTDKFAVCDKHPQCAEKLKARAIPAKVTFKMKMEGFDHRRLKASLLAKKRAERAPWELLELKLKDGVAEACGTSARDVAIVFVEVAFGAAHVSVEVYPQGLAHPEALDLLDQLSDVEDFMDRLRDGLQDAASRGNDDVDIDISGISITDIEDLKIDITSGQCCMFDTRY
eukprot:TRINITY_DN37718_c0_g1_i1.p1 TRINITY_DN37718_c0_g1~~TRINITY_DN37718_c0_g1_i1.p1  ORF type:complete len:741 (+),score=193.73 TRINITY_DN37718_c0_g1_i1:135-2357(+)